MEIKIKRTYKRPLKMTYNIEYRKNGRFSWREWDIRLKKETYGWGLSEIRHKTETYGYNSWSYSNYTNIVKASIPRDVIIKIQNILRGLNG